MNRETIRRRAFFDKTKTFGKGRIFYSSLGHKAEDFNTPETLEIMQRGNMWASKSKYHPKEEWVFPAYA